MCSERLEEGACGGWISNGSRWGGFGWRLVESWIACDSVVALVELISGECRLAGLGWADVILNGVVSCRNV